MNYRVAFDDRWIGDHGIGRFAREIRDRLPGLPDAQLGGSPSDPWDCLRSGLWLSRNRSRWLFLAGYNAPIVCASRCIIGVHDLNHIDSPVARNSLKTRYYTSVLKPACREAALVFTVSEFSRQRIVAWSGASASQIVNVGNGVSEVFKPTGEGACNRSGVDGYFLCVSNRKPHKNESRTFSAFLEANLDPRVRLLVTGSPTPEQAEWLARVDVGGRIRFIGCVSDARLAAYYRDAVGLLFLSLYEGFGLPAVEAMACGTPVIAARDTALAEVTSDAAIQVDPYDCRAITASIEALASDAALQSKLSRRGIKRAALFRWEEVFDRLLSALAERGIHLDSA